MLMIYQELHLGDPPYIIGYRENAPCPVHCHPEIELFYCTYGEYRIRINRTEYRLQEGDLAIISSMTPHELPESNLSFASRSLIVEVGPVMLGKTFEQLCSYTISQPIYSLRQASYQELYTLLQETDSYRENPTPFSSLIIRGNIYKIFAYILKDFASQNDNNRRLKKELSSLMIENVLERIYHDYAKPLSVEEVAAMCGYSKSNFCKIFKQVTGKTFHTVLNDHRLKVACTLLQETQASIDSIAARVGFSDVKSFCRSFKTTLGISPGSYRKQQQTI